MNWNDQEIRQKIAVSRARQSLSPKQIRDDVKRFLANGGKITTLPPCAVAIEQGARL